MHNPSKNLGTKIVTTAKKGFTAIKVLIIPLAPIATGMVTSKILKNGVRIVPRGVVPKAKQSKELH